MARILTVFLIALLASAPARAQEERLSHSAYLEAVGYLEDAADLEQWLRDQLEARKPEWPVERRHQNAAFFAFVLTVSGVTADAASSLEAQGVDVIHGLTENTRPFIEQALLADLVVVGDVVSSERSTEPNDGYGMSDVVQTVRLLKGESPGSSFVIRRRDRAQSRDIAPEPGNRYLLLLSNGMYEFGAARHRAATGGEIAGTRGGHYSIYRIYQMDGGRLLWRNFGREETAQAFEEMQLLDEMLKTAAK